MKRLIVLTALAACTPEGHPAIAIDGDSIQTQGKRLRLYGIDAPEIGQPCRNRDGMFYECGTVAKSFLNVMLNGRSVRCESQGVDLYGRTLATCYIGQTDIGENMVRAGMAVAYTRYTHRYVNAEAEARAARRGIHQGEFAYPETWRRNRQ